MVGRSPYPYVGAGQVGILVLFLVPLDLHLGLVPLHLHLVLVLVPLHLHPGLVPLHLHLGLDPLHLHLLQLPSCAWHLCQRATLNIGSVSTWTLGCPYVQSSPPLVSPAGPAPGTVFPSSPTGVFVRPGAASTSGQLLVSASLPLI